VLDLVKYVFEDRLKDGTYITLRAARSGDGPKIPRAFRSLDRDTVYTRFFGYKTDVSDGELEQLTCGNFDRRVALLVSIGSDDNEAVIGSGGYCTIETALPIRGAEAAFTVEEDYRGKGIATRLMRRIIRIAREKGLTHLAADILARNAPMLAVFRQSGLPMTLRREGDVVHATMCLRASPG
jgi:GNAT superfamily N-acetyltransferase